MTKLLEELTETRTKKDQQIAELNASLNEKTEDIRDKNLKISALEDERAKLKVEV